ncbi:hypothetical protein O9G_003459 [Rozella allomycis CSF55]|uniref:Uncharacterized protein n=1 Tax=Rozella allomycis (strain CSF55) TaxID=988480 RepID=A0A075AUV0_ROZAC|nr:hypothetical protein O9G_003459 [Rozella allomycis CSF55]|eukprot:EPZ33940.1 hypothetical protein O9G_003459 [Rozella allomycis CSF55]
MREVDNGNLCRSICTVYSVKRLLKNIDFELNPLNIDQYETLFNLLKNDTKVEDIIHFWTEYNFPIDYIYKCVKTVNFYYELCDELKNMLESEGSLLKWSLFGYLSRSMCALTKSMQNYLDGELNEGMVNNDGDFEDQYSLIKYTAIHEAIRLCERHNLNTEHKEWLKKLNKDNKRAKLYEIRRELADMVEHEKDDEELQFRKMMSFKPTNDRFIEYSTSILIQ